MNQPVSEEPQSNTLDEKDLFPIQQEDRTADNPMGTVLNFMGLGLMEWLPAEVILAPCLLLVGVGSAGLMPSVFSACVRREASTLVFSSLQTAGQCGYALGIIGSGVVIAAIKLPPETMFVRVFTVTGFCFMVFNVVIVLVLRSMNMRLRQTA